jgi:asparagine synthase (glutamine-hydrolysing)
MAHGLEVRVPYLDREVFEFAMQLPARMKVRFGRRKWLHRQVCRRFLPPEVLRRKKRGFGVDAVDGWLQASMGGKLSGHLLDRHSLIYESFDPEAVRGLLVEHQQRRHDHHKVLFTLVALEEWLRGGAPASSRSPSPFHAAPLAAAA